MCTLDTCTSASPEALLPSPLSIGDHCWHLHIMKNKFSQFSESLQGRADASARGFPSPLVAHPLRTQGGRSLTPDEAPRRNLWVSTHCIQPSVCVRLRVCVSWYRPWASQFHLISSVSEGRVTWNKFLESLLSKHRMVLSLTGKCLKFLKYSRWCLNP